MAESTGVPAIDQALTQFEASNPSFEACPPDDCDDWSGLFAGTLDELRLDPSASEGLCTQMSCELSDHLLELALDAVATSQADPIDPDSPFFNVAAHTPDVFGYCDRPHDSAHPYHEAVLIFADGQTFLVDYTAGQYGYREFPLVQRWAGDRWLREW